MTHTVELNIARKQLTDALGDNYKFYIAALKLWFRRRMTKEEFDLEARKYLTPEHSQLHNRFLLAILNKCQIWTSAHASKETTSSTSLVGKNKLKKGKLKKKSRPIRATFEHRFQPVNPLSCVPPIMAKDPTEDSRAIFCVREATLPDRVMIHGRMFITAWDCGLDAVEDEAVELVLASVEYHLKSILTAIFCRRHSYKLRNRKFVHAIGANLSSPYNMNYPNSTQDSLRRNGYPEAYNVDVDKAEAEAMHHFSGGPYNRPLLHPVSLYDVYETLQLNHHVIPSHTVYAINMERLAARLWHPSHEELQQDDIHQQEEDIRQQLTSQTSF